MGTESSYDVTQYERPSVTVDTVIFTLRQGELQVLLVERKAWPHEGEWAIPGGFVHMDESLQVAAEAGIGRNRIDSLAVYEAGDGGIVRCDRLERFRPATPFRVFTGVDGYDESLRPAVGATAG